MLDMIAGVGSVRRGQHDLAMPQNFIVCDRDQGC
jgi:hypothetical protein